MNKKMYLILSLVFTLFLSACSSPAPTGAPAPVVTGTPTASETPDAFKGMTLGAWQGDVAWFLDSDGFYGLCDKSGKILHEPYFDVAGQFFHGVAVVGRGNLYGYIKQSGQMLTELKWDDAQAMVDGSAAIVKTTIRGNFSDTFLKSVVNLAGQVVVDLGESVDRYGNFVDGFARCETDYNRLQFINASGQFLPGIWNDARDFSEGLAAVYSDRKWGFIDQQGNVVIDFQWDQAWSFSEGLAAVQQGDLWGFVDKSGKMVIEPKWEKALSFSEGLAAVYELGYWGYINQTGEVILKPKWYEAGPFSEGLAGVSIKIDGYPVYRYIDTQGQTVIEPVFISNDRNRIDTLGRFSEGLAKIEASVYRPNYGTPDRRWGFIDKSGNFVIPMGIVHEPGDFHQGFSFTNNYYSINQQGVPVAP